MKSVNDRYVRCANASYTQEHTPKGCLCGKARVFLNSIKRCEGSTSEHMEVDGSAVKSLQRPTDTPEKIQRASKGKADLHTSSRYSLIFVLKSNFSCQFKN